MNKKYGNNMYFSNKLFLLIFHYSSVAMNLLLTSAHLVAQVEPRDGFHWQLHSHSFLWRLNRLRKLPENLLHNLAN